MPPDTDIKFFNAFNLIRAVGPVRFRLILNYFGSLENAWRATPAQLTHAGLENPVVESIVSQRPRIDPDMEFEKLLKRNIKVITFSSPDYPPLLKQIHSPPALLYVRGDHTVLSRHSVGVVGTRKISPYGKQITQDLASALSSSAITVVSGLAVGVDELAHRASFDGKGGTVAVLGSGIDDESIYPSTNRVLASKIVAAGGAVISEFPLHTMPLKMHFPFRNRIIAGLSLGVLVVEADIKSGSLITARFALEENRQVFAVPGSVYNRMSAGPNGLIKQGATPVTEVSDILSVLGLEHADISAAVTAITPDNDLEALLLERLSQDPCHIDTMIREIKLPAESIISALTVMELKGKVRNTGGMQYVKVRN